MSYDARRARLVRVLAAERIDPSAAAVPLASDSNDVWRIGPLVVRVCWRGERARLRREALLASTLPPEAGYPDVVSSGQDGELAWMITRWVDGVSLDSAWPGLDSAERRQAVGQLAEILAALHSWVAPPQVTALLNGAEVELAEPSLVVGASLHPLPVVRAFALAEHARGLPFVDGRVIDEAVARLHLLAGHDPYVGNEDQVVVHGDAHLANLLWRDGRVVALLDFEWARLGPRDLELEPFLRSVTWSGQDPESMRPPELARLFGWLAADYGQLFASPHLVERLWLYQLTCTLCALYTRPAVAPAEQSAPDHPLNLLPRVAAGAHHLERVLVQVRR